jgi:hypothetical protein
VGIHSFTFEQSHSFADRCGGRCGVRLEPWWEVHCTVDDGTGQANILADGGESCVIVFFFLNFLFKLKLWS